MIGAMSAMPKDALRADGMFGPQIDVPADADDQTRFLGYLGRRALKATLQWVTAEVTEYHRRSCC